MKKNVTKKELTDTLQRVQAEFENYRKRTNKEVMMIREMASESLVAKLLPVIDHFELAFKHKEENEFAKGMEMIFGQLKEILEGEGLQEIQQTSIFDPNLHEAIETVKSKKPGGTIIQVFQKGYLFNNKLLRPAKVKVAK